MNSLAEELAAARSELKGLRELKALLLEKDKKLDLLAQVNEELKKQAREAGDELELHRDCPARISALESALSRVEGTKSVKPETETIAQCREDVNACRKILEANEKALMNALEEGKCAELQHKLNEIEGSLPGKRVTAIGRVRELHSSLSPVWAKLKAAIGDAKAGELQPESARSRRNWTTRRSRS